MNTVRILEKFFKKFGYWYKNDCYAKLKFKGVFKMVNYPLVPKGMMLSNYLPAHYIRFINRMQYDWRTPLHHGIAEACLDLEKCGSFNQNSDGKLIKIWHENINFFFLPKISEIEAREGATV